MAAFPPPPTIPGLPTYNIAGVNELFSPTFGYNETLTQGAENALAGGYGGSQFGGNQTIRLLDSERKANFLAGHQILEPYLNRDFQAGQAAADRAARLNEIAAEGAQALQRLQLSEAGAGQRLSTELAERLRQQVLEGNQAMERLRFGAVSEAAQQRTGIGGTLANTLLQGVLSGKGAGVGAPSTRAPFQVGATFGVPSNLNQFNAPVAYNPAARGEGGGGSAVGLGSSSIDQLLRKYGLL